MRNEFRWAQFLLATAGVTAGCACWGQTPSLPPSGEVTINDTAPGWIWSDMSSATIPGSSTLSAHAGGPGSSGIYIFTGTGVTVFGVSQPTIQVGGVIHRAGSLQVLIDGSVKGEYPEYLNSDSTSQEIYAARGLQYGNHSIELKPMDGWAAVSYIVVEHDAAGITSSNRTSSSAQNDLFAIDPYSSTEYCSSDPTATWTTTDMVSTLGVADPAPEALYQKERYGKQFTYTFPGLVPGKPYTVRLHFAEVFWSGPGQRLFNISINGYQALTNFDIFRESGGKDRALVETFWADANLNGQIVIQFNGVVDNAKINAIEIRSYMN